MKKCIKSDMQRTCVKCGVLYVLNVFAEFDCVTDHSSIFTLLNKLESESSGKEGHPVSATLEDAGL